MAQLPLYSQIQMALRQEIESARKPGDTLETEPELEKRFGVSRITIRRALDGLVADGLIVRRQGRGTFVREPQIAQDLTKLLSWTTAMRQLGYEPQTMSMEMAIVEPSRKIAALIAPSPGARVLRIRRVRGAGGAPICIMTNYLRDDLVPHLRESRLVDDSVYATLAAHGLGPSRVEDTVEARAATAEEAAELGIEPGSPLLEVTRLSSDAAGRPLDVAVVSSHADRYSYTVRFEAGDNKDPVVSPRLRRRERESGEVNAVRD